MDIWLINHYAVPPAHYPLTRQTDFARCLQQMGHKVTIFAASTVHNSDRNLITDGRPWREEWVDGVHYVYARCPGYRGSGPARVWNLCRFALALPGVCRAFPRPDAIVATSMPPTSCAMGIRLARKYGCRGVAEIADLWPESIVSYGLAGPRHPAVLALRRLEKWLYRRADAVVFTMEGGYDYIRDRGWEGAVPREKVHFINNGVDLAAFARRRAEFHLPDGDLDDPGLFTVVYTGSVRPANDLGRVLDAARRVTDPRVRFLIWGDGDEAPALRRRCRLEGIGNVCFKGRVDKRYIPSIVSRAGANLMHLPPRSVFRYGISPNKLFEYLAAGRPVLCDFPCGHNPAVERGAGPPPAPPTPEGLARAVEEMSRLDRETYEGYCRAALAAARDYDIPLLARRLAEILEGG